MDGEFRKTNVNSKLNLTKIIAFKVCQKKIILSETDILSIVLNVDDFKFNVIISFPSFKSTNYVNYINHCHIVLHNFIFIFIFIIIPCLNCVFLQKMKIN